MHDYTEQHGPGLHHIGVNVDDLEAAARSMEAFGGEIIMEDNIEGVRS